MSQSTIILDPKSEIRAKQNTNNFIVSPTLIKNRSSIRMESVRELLSWSAKTSFSNQKRIAVIEDFHKSSVNTPHALLKLLEEPPADLQIIILVDQVDSILETVRSRCLIMPVAKLTRSQMDEWGLEKVQPAAFSASESWSMFIQKTDLERLQWTAAYVKSKKSLSDQLLAWQTEIASQIHSGNIDQKLQHIQHLYLIENCLSAHKSNVLPRLILYRLVLQLSPPQLNHL